mgnify:FL=1
MEKIKILLVDDDLKFGNIAVKILQKAGYDVFFQNSLFGVESLIMKLSPNLIILDVMIGEENSLERINDIRLAAEDTPIMCVSSLHNTEFKAEAANNGAMIYIEKPFDIGEFLGWINRYAKHKDFCNSRMINIGVYYTLDTEGRTLSYQGTKEKVLGFTEFNTLKLLWVNKGEIVPRQEFKDTVWKGVTCTDESLNNVIYHLRRYLEKDTSIHLETLRGEGFKMWIEDYCI